MAQFRFMGGGCCCCPEVAFLTDSTGSMGSFISTVKTLFTSLSVELQNRVCAWLVADYKDAFDGIPYSTIGIKIRQPFTSDFSLVQTAINALSAIGGGDFEEQQMQALLYLANNWTSPGVDGTEKNRVLIWAGDAPAKVESTHIGYPSIAAVTAALVAARIKVFTINNQPPGFGIDNPSNAASSIAAATDGESFDSVDPSDITTITAIIEAAINSYN